MPGVVDGFCFNVLYELPENRNNLSNDYLVRIREYNYRQRCVETVPRHETEGCAELRLRLLTL